MSGPQNTLRGLRPVYSLTLGDSTPASANGGNILASMPFAENLFTLILTNTRGFEQPFGCLIDDWLMTDWWLIYLCCREQLCKLSLGCGHLWIKKTFDLRDKICLPSLSQKPLQCPQWGESGQARGRWAPGKEKPSYYALIVSIKT